jgi:ubiquinone biosynthesis protein UbiJ
LTEAEAATAVRIFTESVAHVVRHRADDVAEVITEVEQGMIASVTGAG